MEKLLEMARKRADKVEVYSKSSVTDEVAFENGKLKNVESSMLSGIGLTMIKDGRIGMAYTRNLIDREEFVENALAALAGGVEADYELPGIESIPAIDAWDSGIENLAGEGLVDESSRLVDAMRAGTDGQINVNAEKRISTVRLINSSGIDLSSRSSLYSSNFAIHYPGSYASVHRGVTGKGFVRASDEDIKFVVDVYNASEKETQAASGPTRVLFLPGCMYTLMWRLGAATNAQTVYEKVSPLRDKIGAQVLSSLLTITDTPLDDSRPGARAFDDEGTVCKNRSVFDNGVLKSFYTDRYYAWKMGVQPSGNGWRADISTRSAPGLAHLSIEPGTASFEELLKEMGDGVIVGGALGAHSGNILNGDYSVGLAPGLVVRDGAIVGQVKNAMVSGNVYEDLQRVLAVGDRLEDAYMGSFPPVLVDAVSFSA